MTLQLAPKKPRVHYSRSAQQKLVHADWHIEDFKKLFDEQRVLDGAEFFKEFRKAVVQAELQELDRIAETPGVVETIMDYTIALLMSSSLFRTQIYECWKCLFKSQKMLQAYNANPKLVDRVQSLPAEHKNAFQGQLKNKLLKSAAEKNTPQNSPPPRPLYPSQKVTLGSEWKILGPMHDLGIETRGRKMKDIARPLELIKPFKVRVSDDGQQKSQPRLFSYAVVLAFVMASTMRYINTLQLRQEMRPES